MATKRPHDDDSKATVRAPRPRKQDTLLIQGDRGQGITGRTAVRLGKLLERLRTMPVKKYVDIMWTHRIPKRYKEYMDRPAHEFISKIHELQVAENRAVDVHNRKVADDAYWRARKGKPRKALKKRKKVLAIGTATPWTVEHPGLRACFEEFCMPNHEDAYDVDDSEDFTTDDEPMLELFLCLYEHCLEHKLDTVHVLNAHDMGSRMFLWTVRTLSGDEARH